MKNKLSKLFLLGLTSQACTPEGLNDSFDTGILSEDTDVEQFQGVNLTEIAESALNNFKINKISEDYLFGETNNLPRNSPVALGDIDMDESNYIDESSLIEIIFCNQVSTSSNEEIGPIYQYSKEEDKLILHPKTPYLSDIISDVELGNPFRFCGLIDVDGDGDLDFIGTYEFSPEKTLIHINNEDWTFSPINDPLFYDGEFRGIISGAMAILPIDYDKDGLTDILIRANTFDYKNPLAPIVLLHNKEDGSWDLRDDVISGDSIIQSYAIGAWQESEGIEKRMILALGHPTDYHEDVIVPEGSSGIYRFAGFTDDPKKKSLPKYEEFKAVPDGMTWELFPEYTHYEGMTRFHPMGGLELNLGFETSELFVTSDYKDMFVFGDPTGSREDKSLKDLTDEYSIEQTNLAPFNLDDIPEEYLSIPINEIPEEYTSAFIDFIRPEYLNFTLSEISAPKQTPWGIDSADLSGTGIPLILIAGGKTDIHNETRELGYSNLAAYFIDSSGDIREVTNKTTLSEENQWGDYMGLSSRVDIDGDGRPDIVLGGAHETDSKIYRNDGVDGNNYLSFELFTKSGVPAIGTKIELSVEGLANQTYLYGSSFSPGMGSFGAEKVMFGIGQNDLVDNLKVTFPSGEVYQRDDFYADELSVVVEP